MKIVSWNLLRTIGATLDEVTALIEAERPDLLLMQETTATMAALPGRVGGEFVRVPHPGRVHGVATWSPSPFVERPTAIDLPSDPFYDRVCQIVTFRSFAIANVHLSHGQVTNRRQLRALARVLPPRAAVLGDYNLVGPCLLRGFDDVGPRAATHRMARLVPLRLDRCLTRGLAVVETAVLPRGRSDHRPIMVRLTAEH